MFRWLIGIGVLAAAVLLLRRVLFGRAEQRPEFTEEQYDAHHENVTKGLERVLGPVHDIVGHAIIPFMIGGNVDMYYFPDAVPGTGFATMELIGPDGKGPRPNRIGTYELVSFTKHAMPDTSQERDPDLPFNKIERRLCGIMTALGNYSHMAVLKPGDTCEIPVEEGKPNICILLDEYSPNGKKFMIDGRRHCLLLCMEVFRSEMEYAKKNGSAAVLERLRLKGYYPYSDLDREPVF